MARLNRTTARAALAGLLRTALAEGASPLVAVVEEGLPATFEGQSPVVLVIDEGILRSYRYMGHASFHTGVKLGVLTYVEYLDTAEWTAKEVEDRAAAIEAAIAEVVVSNRANAGVWDLLAYRDEATALAVVQREGREYRREIIPLAAMVGQG